MLNWVVWKIYLWEFVSEVISWIIFLKDDIILAFIFSYSCNTLNLFYATFYIFQRIWFLGRKFSEFLILFGVYEYSLEYQKPVVGNSSLLKKILIPFFSSFVLNI